MSVKIYLEIQMDSQLLDTVPANATNGISFYIFNYGKDPFYSSDKLFDVDLKKENGSIKCTNMHGGYIDTNLILEQDGDEVYLYKQNASRPSSSSLFARTYNYYSDGTYLVCSECKIEYIDATSCKCIMRLVRPTIKVNIKHHANPESILSSIPSNAISSIYIYNILDDIIFSYTPSKDGNTFADATKMVQTMSGCPLVIERDEDEIYLHYTNKPKPSSSRYTTSFGSNAMRQYLSIEHLKFTYVSEREIDLDIYFAPSHGRIVEYYALYTYTALEPAYPDRETNS